MSTEPQHYKETPAASESPPEIPNIGKARVRKFAESLRTQPFLALVVQEDGSIHLYASPDVSEEDARRIITSVLADTKEKDGQDQEQEGQQEG